MNPIEHFLNYLRTEKRCSEHTLLAYGTDLRQFKEYLEDEFDEYAVIEANSSMLRSWLVQLNEFDYESKSIHRKLSTLRSFYKFLRREGLISEDPLLKIRAPKLKKRLPVFIDEKGMKKLLDEVEYPEDWKGKRDHLIVTLFYETGIRQSELIALKKDDVGASGTIKVLGKRNKERIIPISSFCLALIKSYCEAIDNEMFETKETPELFLMDDGRIVNPKFVYQKVNYYLSLVSTVQKRSPHILRHTFATHLLNNGANLNSVKELLGHSSLSATQVYTHNTIDKLKKIHQNNHPRG